MPHPRPVVPSSESRTPSEQPVSPVGPVRPGPGAKTTLAPATVDVRGGFWSTRRQVNERTSIPQGPALLESAGNLSNLRVVAGLAEGEFQGGYPFVDSDVYKWLEAASWQLARQTPDADSPLAAEVERLVSSSPTPSSPTAT